MDILKQLSDHVNLQSLESALAAVQVPNERLAEVDSLSNEEVRSQLKLTLDALVAKERDLVLAAQIGQSLLDANNDLRAALVEAEAAAPVRAAARSRDRLAQSLDAHQVSGDTDEGVASLDNHILELESHISSLHDQILELRNNHRRDINSLTDDVNRERSRADQLDTKLTELTLIKDKLVNDNLTLKFQVAQGTGDEADSLDKLLDDLISLRNERDSLVDANIHLTEQLASAITSTETMRSHVDDANKQLRDHSDLQDSYKYQSRHILELRELVDDLRSHLSRLAGQDDLYSGLHNPSTTWTSAAAVEPSSTSLISELEAAWVKEHSEPKTGFSGLLEGFRSLLLD